MNKSQILLLSIMSSTVFCHATALENLKIPKGMSLSALQKKEELQVESRHKAIKYKISLDNTLPPKRMITSHKGKKEVKFQREFRISTHEKLADTTHMAVLLKNSGYRLYKKRTRANENSWTYWLKNKEGNPLFKVELVRDQTESKIAKIQLWSWDDRTQMNISERKDLVKIFGEIVS